MLTAHLRDGARWLKWFAGEHERAQRVAGHVDEATALLERYEVCSPRPHPYSPRRVDNGTCSTCGGTFQHPLHDTDRLERAVAEVREELRPLTDPLGRMRPTGDDYGTRVGP